MKIRKEIIFYVCPHDSNEDLTGAKWKETHHTPHLKSGYVPLLLPLFLPEDGESGRLPTRVPSALTTSNRRLSPYFTEAIKIKLQDLGEIRIWELPHHQIIQTFYAKVMLMIFLPCFMWMCRIRFQDLVASSI